MISLSVDEIITFSKNNGSNILDLNGKNLKKIPKKVFTIKNIENLYLQENKINYISPKIANLKYLEVIALDDLTIYNTKNIIERLNYDQWSKIYIVKHYI